MIKSVAIAFSFLFVIAAILVFRPVPIVAEHEALTDSGVVSGIFEGGDKDVVFRLENNDRLYYINRGLELDLEINSLKEQLMGNEVTFKYPKYWTPLDWDGKTKHLLKVECNNEVIFNELK